MACQRPRPGMNAYANPSGESRSCTIQKDASFSMSRRRHFYSGAVLLSTDEAVLSKGAPDQALRRGVRFLIMSVVIASRSKAGFQSHS